MCCRALAGFGQHSGWNDDGECSRQYRSSPYRVGKRQQRFDGAVNERSELDVQHGTGKLGVMAFTHNSGALAARATTGWCPLPWIALIVVVTSLLGLGPILGPQIPRARAYPSPSNDAATCKPGDLGASAYWGGAAGSVVGRVVLTNWSLSICSLRGYPSVQVRSRNGHAVGMIERHTRRDRLLDAGVPMRERVSGQLLPQRKVAFDLYWLSWCGGPISRPVVLWVRISPQGGVVRVAVNDTLGTRRWEATPPCYDQHGFPGRLNIGPFQPMK